MCGLAAGMLWRITFQTKTPDPFVWSIRRAWSPVLVLRIADRLALFFEQITSGHTGEDADADEQATIETAPQEKTPDTFSCTPVPALIFPSIQEMVPDTFFFSELFGVSRSLRHRTPPGTDCPLFEVSTKEG